MVTAAFQLTPEQEEISRYLRDEKGNLMVVARAGSGKTSTLVEMARVMREPSALCLAFNKSIATEMQERLPSNCTASTLNSVGFRAWGASRGMRMELDTSKNTRIIYKLLDDVPKEERDSWDSEIVGNLPRIVATAKVSGFLPAGIPRTDSILSEEEFFEGIEYELEEPQRWIVMEALRLSWLEALEGKIDFDDQILCPTLDHDASFRSYPVTFIDEAQDLSLLNHRMVSKIVKNNRLVVVGDPCQAIYGFRGANEDSMSLLGDMFSMDERKLTISFRCDRSIIENVHWRAPDMRWRDGAGEGEVRTLKSWGEQDIPNDSAVLCRNNAPLLASFINLLLAGRMPTLGNKEVVYTFVKILQSFGPTGMRADDVLKRIDAWEEKTKKTRKGEDAKDNIADTAQCLRSVVEFKGSLGEAIGFLRDAADRKGNIMLSTVHRAKGLEYDTVSILDVELIKSIGQDPNIKYVAETRARHTLSYISSAGYTTVLEQKEAEEAGKNKAEAEIEADVEIEAESVPKEEDTYLAPVGGWTCFHCGETFTTEGSASDHFGERPGDVAACRIKSGEERGLVMQIRRLQSKIRGLEAEVTYLQENPTIPA